MQISVEIEEAVVNSARRVALFNFVAGGQVHSSSSRYTALLHYYGVSQSNNETKFPREAIESPKVVLESVWIKTRSMLSKKALSSHQLFIYHAKSPNNSDLFYFLSLKKRVKAPTSLSSDRSLEASNRPWGRKKFLVCLKYYLQEQIQHMLKTNFNL